MPRPLADIIAHIRAVAANPAVSTTLIQTEDLEALCDAATKPLDALDDEDMKQVAIRVRRRMIEKLGPTRVQSWMFANADLVGELGRQTYLAVRWQIENKSAR